MQTRQTTDSANSVFLLKTLPALCAAALLAACGGSGGGSGSTDSTSQPAAIATSDTTLQMTLDSVPAEVAAQTVQAAFHLAPVVLDAPPDVQTAVPHMQSVPMSLVGVSSRQLSATTVAALQSFSDAAGAQPMATSGVLTYTPAQIRAAYGMPALPTGTPTAAQAAQMGAGQTIYIIDAMHDPNVAAELAAFNQKFALPACTNKAIAATASLPLATASATACEFSVVYATASGTMTATAPAYDSGWATEITLDVQWAHATAPLARIVLIEAPDASIGSLTGAVRLANTMGPGIVSMSFGASEGSWTSSVDSAFAATNMTYLAATGDWGTGVSWPSVSASVVAVGGTKLTYSGSGSRSEVSWSSTGGGVSAYTATPSYQSSAVPGMGTAAHRMVADVSFNADPNTGQYVATIASGSSTVQWVSAGGTSLSTPQWAGLIAVANATRLNAGKAILGEPHAVIYGQIATTPGTYASVFADVTSGSNGTCSVCTAKTGYDSPTGLGTPNVTSLLNTLGSATVATPAPVVTPASISGTAGTALSFTVSVTASNPVTYALTGAPSGLAISTAGVVTWASPVAGTYTVTVTAKDSVTSKTGQGVYTITIAPKPTATAPVVTGATISGQAGVALSFTVSTSSSTPVTYTLTGAPSGMAISTAGVVSWAKPVAGSYTVTVTAKSTTTALSGSGVFTVKIGAAGPVITAPAATGTAGQTLTGTIAISDPGASYLNITISGVPLGMQFAVSGQAIAYAWPKAVAGSYTLKITVTDSAGLSAQATVPITVK